MDKNIKVLTVRDLEHKAQINALTKEYFHRSPDALFSDNKEMFEFAEKSGKRIILVLMPEVQEKELIEEKKIGGRPTGTYKQPTEKQMKALIRELYEKLEYKKNVLEKVVGLTQHSFIRFMVDNPLLEQQRVKNQDLNREMKKKGIRTEIVAGLKQITMKMK